MLYDLLYVFLFFLIYSFCGYILEVIVVSVPEKKFMNRGFLFGPLCPIYGVGALAITYGLERYSDNPIILFVLGVIITSGIEYYTSYIFEKIFHNKWWDYSNRSDNLNGRICLGNSIGFGIGALLIIYVFNPIIKNALAYLSRNTIITIGLLLFIIFIIDLIWSIVIAYNLRERLIVAEELKNSKLKALPSMLLKSYNDQISKIRIRTNRLLKVYPNMAKNLRKELNKIQDILNKK